MTVRIKKLCNLVTAIMVVVLTGCGVPKTINPPRGTDWITVKGVMPPHTYPVIWAGYDSATCSRMEFKGGLGGSLGSRSESTSNQMPVEHNLQTGEFIAKVPMEGGTRCNWLIRGITVAIRYSDTQHLLGKDVETSGNLINVKINWKFKGNNLRYQNKIAIYSRYYPVYELYTGSESIRLVNVKASSSGMYKDFYDLAVTPDNEVEIIYSPTIDDEYLVKQIMENENAVPRMEYPDGTVLQHKATLKRYPRDRLAQYIAEHGPLVAEVAPDDS